MLTFFVLLSSTIITGKTQEDYMDLAAFEQIYNNNPGVRITNQFNEQCIRILNVQQEVNLANAEGGLAYCKNAQDDHQNPRKCIEIRSTTDTSTAVICAPPSSSSPQSPGKTDDNSHNENDENVCNCNCNCNIVTDNTHVQQYHPPPQVTEYHGPPTVAPTTPFVGNPEGQQLPVWTYDRFEQVWNMQYSKHITGPNGEDCVGFDPSTIWCKTDDDKQLAFPCKRNQDTNEIICYTEQDIIKFEQQAAPQNAQLRDNDYTNGYISTNDSDTLHEQLRISLISLWVVLALVVIANGIFIWYYMRRKKQRTHVVVNEVE